MYCVNMKELCNVIRTEVNIMAENDQYLRFSSNFFSLKLSFVFQRWKKVMSNAGLDNMIK